MINHGNIPACFELATDSALKENGHDVTVHWNEVFTKQRIRVVKLTCNRCNTTCERPTNTLRKGVFLCSGCSVRTYTEKLKGLDYTFIEYIKDKQICICSCDICGSEVVARVSSFMRGNRPRCVTCRDAKYSEVADKLGFDFISTTTKVSRTGTYCTLRCRKDNHSFDVASCSLLKGIVVCRQCQVDSYISALSEKHCEFIDVVQTENRRRTRVRYKTPDGAVLEAASANILDGKFSPSINGPWHQKHEVYCCIVVYRSDIFIKIGTANNSLKRIKNLRLEVDSLDIKVLRVFEDRFGADSFEQMLHDKYREYSIDRSIPSQFTRSIKTVELSSGECYRRVDGSTEWFSAEILKDILDHYVQ